MSEIRRRKAPSSKKEKTQTRNGHVSQTKDDSREGILTNLSVAVGIIGMVAMGYIHANYMVTIHENWMWFSNIKVIDRSHSYFMPQGLL